MKKILFVIESLVCAGAEKSLVTLLNLIDYSKYEVDLQLFSYGGEFESMLPKKVNVLPELSYFASTRESLANVLKRKKTIDDRKNLYGRIKYSVALRTGKYNNPQKAVLFWKSARECFQVSTKQYDVAIAYAQGAPTFYVADCIKAKKKFAWINSIYKLTGKDRDFVLEKYKCFNKINCVSEVSLGTFNQVFPELVEKGTIIYDINDGNLMMKMSEMESTVESEMKEGKVKLLTIGRFAVQKGYNIAMEACLILKERGIDFVWYVLGRGPLEAEIRQYIDDNNLSKHFVLLGTRVNPYPYIKKADIYVQTSTFEGYGLAIAEARMLNTPVVTTRFDAVYAQMIHEKNGLVVDLDAEAVADGIERLIKDRTLYDHIMEYQMCEKKGNYEEIEKFYSLIEENE